MSMEVAGLYTTLTQADEQFVAACARDKTALENVAVASEATTASVKSGAAAQGAATEASAAKTVASQSRMGKGWADLTKQIEEHGNKTTQVWSKITHAGEISSIALLAAGAESVHLAADFQSTMELVHTQAGAAQSEVDALAKQVIALAPTVGMGPDRLAEGLYHIESAGFRGKEAMEILGAASKDAAIGMSDMETTTQAMIGVMAVGFSDVKDAADAAAFLNTTVGIGDMRMEKLAAAVSTGVLPSFKSAGLGMTDFSAALATLTDNVTPADEAATRLRMTVSLLAAPSSTAFKALTAIGLGADEANAALANRSMLDKYGISISKLSEDLRKPDGLLVATMDLKHHLEASGLTATEQTAVIEKAFGGGRTSGAILTLLEESDRLQSKYEAIGTAASRAEQSQDAWASTQATFKQQLHEVGAQIQVIGIGIGDWLLPPLTKMVGFMVVHQGALKIFFLILVAGMVAFTAAVIANTIAMLANPITWIVLGIVAAIALLVLGIYELVTHWSTIWAWIKRIALDVWHWLVDAWHATLNWFVQLWHDVWDPIRDTAVAVWHWLVDAWHNTINALATAAEWVKTRVIYPIVLWIHDYLVVPFKFLLKALQVAWEFAWGFLSQVIAHFRKNWDLVWAAVAAAVHWAWENVLKPVFGFITRYGLIPLLVAIAIFKEAWRRMWSDVGSALEATWNFLKMIWGYVYEDGIKPIGRAVSWLGDRWSDLWGLTKSKAQDAWNFLKILWGYIYEDGIKPIERAVSWLGDRWSELWGAITGTVSSAWDHLKPIFDKIGGAFDKIIGSVKTIVNSPGQAGQAFAKLLGFDQGGWVPGPPGAPMMAVVHGGEFVVSHDMLAGRQAMPIQAGRSSGSVGTGTPAPHIIQNHVHLYVDGEELQRVSMKGAGRNKLRNGNNGLSG